MPSLFDFPEIYEAVMPRPINAVETEAANIEWLLAQRGVAHAHILDLACGAGAHAISLAQRGHRVTGLDASAAMLALAQQRAQHAGVDLALVHGDVVEFELKAPPRDDTQFDCALFMFETFQLISRYDEIVRHFAAVRRHLRPGGLYVIDLAPCRHGVGVAESEWGRRTIALPNGSVETWNMDYPGDWVEGTSHLVVHCRVEQDGRVFETVDDWRLRMYSPWELRLLVKTLPGWALEGFFAWDTLRPDIADSPHYWMVLTAMSDRENK